ncbi:MAG: MFS transporter [Acidobacteriota bacterium]
MEDSRLRYRRFLLLWLGQFVSNFGTALTSFAVGVWVYQQTGSTTSFSFTLFSSSLPGVLAGPLVGSLIDRYDRRLVLLLSNLGAMAGIGALTLLFAWREPGLLVICLLLAVVAVFRTAQWTTFSALIAFLVPQERLGKANGLVELGRSLSEIGAPILAGFLLTRIEVSKILAIDTATYFLAVLILWRLPFRDVVSPGGPRKKTLAGEVWEGFLYIWQRSGLWTLLILFSSVNFIATVLQVILTPFVLSMATAQELGLVMGIGSSGMVLGGLAISFWGVPQRKIPWILGLLALQASTLIVMGIAPGVVTTTVCLFVFMTLFPIISGMSLVIWQTQTERSYHGRIFAIRRTIATATVPVAYLLSGPLGDTFASRFAPTLWASAEVPPEARGLGLLFLLFGGLALLVVLIAAGRRVLHELETLGPSVES